MKKIIIVICAILLPITGFFSGCTQDSHKGGENNEEINHFIGIWGNISTSINSSGIEEYFVRIYNFTENTFNYSYYAENEFENHQWYTEGMYEINDGNLTLNEIATLPPKTFTYRYSFSYDYTRLTLTNESGESVVFTK